LRARCPNRVAASAAAFLLACALPVAMTVGASRAAAQVSSPRSVCFTVTDPEGRIVTGLEREHFEVSENGLQREITEFLGTYSSLKLAIVSAKPLPTTGLSGSTGELIQATTVSEALSQLAATPSSRQGIIAVTGTDIQAIPADIPILQVDPAGLPKAVLALREQYCLRVEPSSPSARVDVVVHPLRSLPALNVNLLGRSGTEPEPGS
jgi:hypothetical protein